MRFTALLAFVTAVSVAVATPAAHDAPVAHAGTPESPVTLTAQSGCGSIGPLGNGHWVWWITVSCTPGGHYTCQATDKTGCIPGNVANIANMQVDDPNDTYTVASADDANAVAFVCPSIGEVRCQSTFKENDDSPNYSLRVFVS
ncbi:hypothetical protein ACG7TL_005200 [Trametes sanguinea]